MYKPATGRSVLRPVQVTLTLSDDPHLSPNCVARGAVIRIGLKFQHPNVELILHASIICWALISYSVSSGPPARI